MVDTSVKSMEIAEEIWGEIEDRFTRHPRNPQKSMLEVIKSIIESHLDDIMLEYDDDNE